MNRLIGDLVDVASIEAGKILVTPSLQDANALVRESVEAFQPLAPAQGLSLDGATSENPLMARFDHERLLQVVANLLSNAIKFTRPGGRISIRVEPRGQEVHFSVTDTGSGIPKHQLEAVFERFWQARSEDRRGLGLGLYISRCIVEAHGGVSGPRVNPARAALSRSRFRGLLPHKPSLTLLSNPVTAAMRRDIGALQQGDLGRGRNAAAWELRRAGRCGARPRKGSRLVVQLSPWPSAHGPLNFVTNASYIPPGA
jgi:signal transduction histidine kinase